MILLGRFQLSTLARIVLSAASRTTMLRQGKALSSALAGRDVDKNEPRWCRPMKFHSTNEDCCLVLKWKLLSWATREHGFLLRLIGGKRTQVEI